MRAAIAIALIAACGAPGTGDDAPMPDGGADGRTEDGGADGAPDADPTAPDAMPPDGGEGLPLGSDCDVLTEPCADGLTCRLTGIDPVSGRCMGIGPAAPGDVCNPDNGSGDCGAAQACIASTGSIYRCFLICDVADPDDRCTASTPTCSPVFTPELGACVP